MKMNKSRLCQMFFKEFSHASAMAALITFSASSVLASDWSDAYIGYRYGAHFAEPFNGNNISKNIFNLSYVGGYRYGINFINVDMLMSNRNDPAYANATTGARETYIVYRHTLDIGKVRGEDIKFGPFRGVGITTGFDWNAKGDAGYNSKKHMLVLGPTLMANVRGHLNMSILELWESNQPYNTYTQSPDPCNCRYHYSPHPEFDMNWGIPFSIGSVALSYEGYADFIAAKGKDEFGKDTAMETNIDAEIMYDLGALTGAAKNTFKVGLEYQYWKNKFGNNASGSSGSGAFAKTGMIRAEYHF